MKTRTDPLFFFSSLTLPSSLALLPPLWALVVPKVQGRSQCVTAAKASRWTCWWANPLPPLTPLSVTSYHWKYPEPRMTWGVQDQARAEMIMKWGFFFFPQKSVKPLGLSLCFCNSVLIKQLNTKHVSVPDVQLVCFLKHHCLRMIVHFYLSLVSLCVKLGLFYERVCQNVRLICNIKIPSVAQSLSSSVIS